MSGSTLVDVLEEHSVPSTEDKSKLPSVEVLTTPEKASKCFDLKMSGISIKSIAHAMDASESTVYRWIAQHARHYRESMEGVQAIDVIADSLLFYDSLEDMCLLEATQLGVEGATVDPKTGKVTDNLDLGKKGMKLKYIEAAKDARNQKLRLQQSTGMLPKQAEKLYVKVEEEKRLTDEDKEVKVRTEEEIKESIKKLVAQGRSVT